MSASSSTTGAPAIAHPLRWLWLSGAVIALDQLTKQLAEALLNYDQPLVVLSWFHFTLRYNTGAAFSFLAEGSGWQRWFFVLLALAVSAFLGNWLRRLPRGASWEALGLALILGGALGNVIDRVLFAHVIDFIEVYLPFLPWRTFNPWPAFNIADSAISVGVVVLIADNLFNTRAHRDEERADG